MAARGEPVPELSPDDADNVTTSGERLWIPFVEPIPNWHEARVIWGPWWQVHIYLTASLFLLLALYCLINVVYICRLWAKSRALNIQQAGYFVSIHILMIIFSGERALFMLLDAYNIKGTLAPVVAYLFISIGLPCMTASFYLIFVAFMKATRLKLPGRSLFSLKALVGIILGHFVVSIALDIAAGFTLQALYLLVICQSIFIVWGYILSVVYVALFFRIYKASVGHRKKIIRMSMKFEDTVSVPGKSDPLEKLPTNVSVIGRLTSTKWRKGVTGGREPTRRPSVTTTPRPKLAIGAKLILVSAVLLFITASLYLYSILGIFTKSVMFGDDPDPWTWWGCEFSVRMCEVGLCATISVAGTQPIVRNIRERRSTKKRRQGTPSSNQRKTSYVSETNIENEVKETPKDDQNESNKKVRFSVLGFHDDPACVIESSERDMIPEDETETASSLSAPIPSSAGSKPEDAIEDYRAPSQGSFTMAATPVHTDNVEHATMI